MKISENLITAYSCAAYDIKDRLFSLSLELRHLQQNAAYFLCNSFVSKILADEDARLIDSGKLVNNNDIKELIDSLNDNDKHHGDTEKAPSFILIAAQQLKENIYCDVDKIEKLYSYIEEMKTHNNSYKLNNNKAETLKLIRKTLFLQAFLRKRADYHIRDLGRLQDRFGQELERIKPDSPGPTNRRRQEHGIIDKYLSELTRWVHRDLIVLVKDIFNSPYPYSETPITLQYWQYDYRSQHNAIHTDSQHERWRDWMQSKSTSCEGMGKEQSYFIQQSFWALERPAIHPIIAHELAHRVVRDGLGRHYIPAVGDAKTAGDVGRLIRRLKSCLEAWLATNDTHHMRLDEEIIADILAASRFGHAYLYTWFLEMLKSEHESNDQLRDEHGWLESTDIDKQAACPIPFPCTEIPSEYLRGKVLLRWLSAMSIQEDSQAVSLRSAVLQHLELQLECRFESNPKMKAFWEACSVDLVDAALGFGAAEKASKLWRGMLAPDKLGKAYPTHVGWFMYRQRLNYKTRKWLAAQANLDEKVLHSAVEIPWRKEWKNASSSEENPQLRKVFDVAMDDYLYRTANPRRLQGILGIELELEQDKKANFELSNTISEQEHKEYWDTILEKLLTKIPSLSTGKPHINFSNIIMVDKGDDGSFNHHHHLGELYHLELLVMASPIGEKLDVSHCINSDWIIANPASDILTDSTLGRYDRFVLYKIDNNASNALHKWEYIPTPTDSSRPSYYARKRLLREIKCDTFSKKHVSIIVFISLKCSALRFLFLQWILNDTTQLAINLRKSISSMYMSNGWEDFILLLSPEEAGVSKYSQLIRDIHDLPLVKATESIYTFKMTNNALVDMYDEKDSGYKLVYLIRLKNGTTPFLDELTNNIPDDITPVFSPHKPSDLNCKSLFIEQVYGDMDFALEMPYASRIQHKLLLELLYSLKSVSRVQPHYRQMVNLDHIR